MQTCSNLCVLTHVGGTAIKLVHVQNRAVPNVTAYSVCWGRWAPTPLVLVKWEVHTLLALANGNARGLPISLSNPFLEFGNSRNTTTIYLFVLEHYKLKRNK